MLAGAVVTLGDVKFSVVSSSVSPTAGSVTAV